MVFILSATKLALYGRTQWFLVVDALLRSFDIWHPQMRTLGQYWRRWKEPPRGNEHLLELVALREKKKNSNLIKCKIDARQ